MVTKIKFTILFILLSVSLFSQSNAGMGGILKAPPGASGTTSTGGGLDPLNRTTISYIGNQIALPLDLTFDFISLVETGSGNILGIPAPPVGESAFLVLINSGASTITWENENILATAENRIKIRNDGNYSMLRQQMCLLWYDPDLLRWRVMSVS